MRSAERRSRAEESAPAGTSRRACRPPRARGRARGGSRTCLRAVQRVRDCAELFSSAESGEGELEDAPLTDAGMTVLAPGVLNAPSMPWMLKLG